MVNKPFNKALFLGGVRCGEVGWPAIINHTRDLFGFWRVHQCLSVNRHQNWKHQCLEYKLGSQCATLRMDAGPMPGMSGLCLSLEKNTGIDSLYRLEWGKLKQKSPTHVCFAEIRTSLLCFRWWTERSESSHVRCPSGVSLVESCRDKMWTDAP